MQSEGKHLAGDTHLNETITTYLNLLSKSGYTSYTVIMHKTTLNSFANYLNENSINDFNDVDITLIEKYYAFLKQKGFKEVTINNHRKRLKKVFNYLFENKKIKHNLFIKKEKTNYSDEFMKYYNEYIRIKEFENTCYNSMKKIKRSLNQFYTFLSDRGLENHRQVRKEDLKDFVKYLVDLTDKKLNPLYKTESVNRVLSDLKPYIQVLSKKGVFANGFSSNLKFLHITQQIRRNILTRKELVALFNIKAESLYEFTFKSIFIIQYATGLRINELLNIELKDIDFENNILKIFESKTNKERVVQAGEVGTNYLKIFIDEVRPKVCYDYLKSNTVFLSFYEGKRLNDGTVNRYLKEFCKKALITKKVTSHCFRHSYGTHLLENGLGIKEVSDLLGHTDLATTERYTQLSPRN